MRETDYGNGDVNRSGQKPKWTRQEPFDDRDGLFTPSSLNCETLGEKDVFLTVRYNDYGADHVASRHFPLSTLI